MTVRKSVFTAAIVALAITVGSVGLLALFAIAREGPRSESASGESEVEISATELLTAYETDETAADHRFKNRRVIVAGEVQQIGRDMLGSAYLLLEVQGHFYGVQLLFPSSAETAVGNKGKGEHVRVRCVIAGKRGSVIAHDCALL